jgi:hypothetical protein
MTRLFEETNAGEPANPRTAPVTNSPKQASKQLS